MVTYPVRGPWPWGGNEFLSTMVEDSLNDLVHAGCVELEDDSDAVHSTPMGRVASDYYLKHLTLGVFSDSMHDRMEVEELLHLLCAATEYDETPVRHNEDEVNSPSRKPSGPLGAGLWIS